MARKVAWAKEAWTDLRRVVEFISRDSKGNSKAFVERVWTAARSLSKFAVRGRPVRELKELAVRELVVGRYRLIYKSGKDAVTVLAFIHGARDLPALWKKRELHARDDEE